MGSVHPAQDKHLQRKVAEVTQVLEVIEVIHVTAARVTVVQLSHLALGDEEHHRGAFQIKPLLPHGAFVDVDARHLDGFVFEE